MSRLSENGSTPDFLQAAVEYRERLREELAKVDKFLRADGEREAVDEAEYPDFLLLGDDELLDGLCTHGDGSRTVH